MMKKLVTLFLTFAKVGVMTFGGGYAMLPILQREVVEKKGWVTRTTCPNDKRAYLVTLTEEGRQVIERALPHHITKIEETFAVLIPQEQLELIRLLKKFKPREHNHLQKPK